MRAREKKLLLYCIISLLLALGGVFTYTQNAIFGLFICAFSFMIAVSAFPACMRKRQYAYVILPITSVLISFYVLAQFALQSR